MRCYFMRGGHIADVEMLPGLGDKEAVEFSHRLFKDRKDKSSFDGFELWEQARKIMQYPPLKDPGESMPAPES